VRLAGMGDIVNRIFTEVRFFFASLTLPHRIDRKGYPKYKKRFGKDQAKKILENEKVSDLTSVRGFR
jgi:hypothetical protein